MLMKVEKIYTRSKIAKAAYWAVVNFISILLIILFYIIYPVKHIKLIFIEDRRIGHLAADTELFLRRLKAGSIKSAGITFVGIATTDPANKQLLEMFKRQIKIIQLPYIKFLDFIVRSILSDKSVFAKSIFYQKKPHHFDGVHEFNNIPTTISFTKEEEERGKKLLRKMGIKEGGWFVCIHARDTAYMSKYEYKMGEWKYHNFRNAQIATFLKAAEYITSKGGFVIRMGAVVEKKLPETGNPKIIDYATKYRSDFGDAYLPAKCKFFISSPTGLFHVSTIFNIPAAVVDFIPLRFAPLLDSDMYIPKKLWSKKKKKFLTFKEIFNSGISDYFEDEKYEKAGIVPGDSTPEEILDLAKEMNELLDGKLKYTKEDEKLRKKFRSYIKSYQPAYRLHSKIGATFLRKNKWVLK